MISIRIPAASLRILDSLGSRLLRIDTRATLIQAGEYMHDQIGERFSRESGLRGKWKKLAPSTIADRRRLGYGPEHPILQRKRSLIKAATGNFNRNKRWTGTSYNGARISTVWIMEDEGLVGGRFNKTGIRNRTLTIGIDSEGGYATVLNSKRPFMYTTQANERAITAIFERWAQYAMGLR